MKLKFLSIATVAAAIFIGCTTVKPFVAPVLSAVACASLTKYPEATPFMGLAAQVFTDYGKATPPTPADLQAALARITVGNTTIPAQYAALAWTAAVEAYKGIYSLAKTDAQKADLRATLTGIGTALQEAVVACGKTSKALRVGAVPQAPEATVTELSNAIAAQIKARL